MVEAAHPVGHGEAPVNPYNLLEALNRASAETRNGWLLAFLLIAFAALPLAGIAHRDLLMEIPVSLPLAGTRVPLIVYAALAPLAIVLVHAATLTQHALLAGKAHAFDTALRTLETSEARTHPLRLEIYPYFLTEALAGPRRGLAVRLALRLMGALGVVLLPAILLLVVQIVFVPYHATALTAWHRGLVLADLLAVAAFSVFLSAPGPGWGCAIGRMVAVKPFASFVGLVAVTAIAVMATAVATVPGETLDGLLHKEASGRAGGSHAHAQPGVLSPIEHWVPRRLHPGRAVLATSEPNASGLDLSGRDLSGINLEGARLTGVDLTGANLKGARLAGADLGGARLAGANLEYANLDRAWLAGADLTRARLVAASLNEAELEGASLAAAHAEGASLGRASLAGADLGGAVLMGADLLGAVLAGANLAEARLDAARLKEADLEAAVLTGASLVAADLTDARIGAADLRRARIWQAQPPAGDPGGLADLTDAELRAPDEKAVAELKQAIAAVGVPEGVAVLQDALRGVLDPADRGKWSSSPDHAKWQTLVSAGYQSSSGSYRGRLTDLLVRTVCKPRAGAPGIGIGVVRRASTRDFRGDATTLGDRVKGDDCAASRNIPARLLQDLAVAAERARSEQTRAEPARPESPPKPSDDAR